MQWNLFTKDSEKQHDSHRVKMINTIENDLRKQPISL